jgi:uncharacterized protein YjbJ (UPF0337 family)
MSANLEQTSGKGERFKGGVQMQWGKLTDEDLGVIDGKRKKLVGELQEKYGMSQEYVEEEVERWLVNFRLEEH